MPLDDAPRFHEQHDPFMQCTEPEAVTSLRKDQVSQTALKRGFANHNCSSSVTAATDAWYE